MWRDLYDGIARRDGDAMSASGRRLLTRYEDMSDHRSAYVISAAMLGDIASGRPLEAHATWVTHGQERFEGNDLPEHVKLILSVAVGAAATAEAQAAR